MAKQTEILGEQNNPTGEQAGGFLAGTREVFESATSDIRDATRGINEALGLGGGFDQDGKPILRTSQLAHRTFGQGVDSNLDNPFLKFQYFVRINYNGALKDFVEQYFGKKGGFEKNSTFVKNVTMPSIGIESEVFNEYNRKRISQTKLKFDPVDIVFHDVLNGNCLRLWQMYYQYYFSDGKYDKSAETRDAPVNPEEIKFKDFGYNLDQVEDIRYLFKSIEIFQLSGSGNGETRGGTFNKVTLYNPRIVDFKHDTLDYSSSDLVEVKYSLEYEWAEYDFRLQNRDGARHDIKNEQDIFDYLGQSNYLEYAEFVNGPQPAVDEGYPDGILGDLAEIVDTVQTGIETVNEAKAFARNIAGKVQSVSALGNQIQKEILGVDEPPFPLPDVRGFTSRIDDIPTNYPDVRRVRKGG